MSVAFRPRRAERAARMRETSSCAVTEPRMGTSHPSAVAKSGRDSRAASAPTSAEIRPAAAPGPPAAPTSANSRTSSPMMSAIPWMMSVVASASSPPEVV